MPHVRGKSLGGHYREEPALDLATQVCGSAHVTASPWRWRKIEVARPNCGNGDLQHLREMTLRSA